MRKYLSRALIDETASIHMFFAEEPKISLHTHDFIEIIYVNSGTSTHRINGAFHTARAGDLLFINYGAEHIYEGGEGYSFYNICFNPEMLSTGVLTRENAFAFLQLTAFDEIRNENEDGIVSFKGESRLRLERLLSDMLLEYTEKKRGWCDALKSYMNILLMHILRRLSGDEIDTDADVWHFIASYIDENLDTDLSLAALAEKCFYNPSYFSRAFKERFNMPLTRYVAKKKATIAAALIEEGQSTREIVERLGFGSKASLYRAISKELGKSITEVKNS